MSSRKIPLPPRVAAQQQGGSPPRMRVPNQHDTCLFWVSFLQSNVVNQKEDGTTHSTSERCSSRGCGYESRLLRCLSFRLACMRV